MTRNEVKELLPIMQAFAEGKTIEERIIGNDNWIETDEIYGGRNNDYDYRVNYRIKPTPKYRPFANAEECLEEMKKHIPFGWVKDKFSFYPIERVGTNFGKKCIRKIHEKKQPEIFNIFGCPINYCVSILSIRCRLSPKSAFHSKILRDGKLHDICRSLNLQNTLLFVVCCNNYQPSSDTNEPLSPPYLPAQ